MKFIYALANVKLSKIDEFIDVAKELISQSRAEEGNAGYELVRIDETTFAFVEHWKSIEAIEIHNSSTHFIQAVEKLNNLLSSDLVITVSDVFI